MTGPRPINDPRPVVYLGPVASVLAGFLTVAAVMAAGAAVVGRWARRSHRRS